MNISDIFFKGLEQEKNSIIKTIPINWSQHSNGIVNIADS